MDNNPLTTSFTFLVPTALSNAAENENGTMVARKTMVKVGKVYNGNAEILSGLKAGDKIITLGYDDLNNGDAISI